jgi:hypothetical protein
MSLLVALGKIDSCGFLKQLKGAYIFKCPGMHFHFGVLDPKDWIKEYVRFGVNITSADKVLSCGKVTPSAWLQLLGKAYIRQA